MHAGDVLAQYLGALHALSGYCAYRSAWLCSFGVLQLPATAQVYVGAQGGEAAHGERDTSHPGADACWHAPQSQSAGRRERKEGKGTEGRREGKSMVWQNSGQEPFSSWVRKALACTHTALLGKFSKAPANAGTGRFCIARTPRHCTHSDGVSLHIVNVAENLAHYVAFMGTPEPADCVHKWA